MMAMSFLMDAAIAAIAAVEHSANKLMLTGTEQTLKIGADLSFVHSAKNFKCLIRQDHLFFAIWLVTHDGGLFQSSIMRTQM